MKSELLQQRNILCILPIPVCTNHVTCCFSSFLYFDTVSWASGTVYGLVLVQVQVLVPDLSGPTALRFGLLSVHV